MYIALLHMLLHQQLYLDVKIYLRNSTVETRDFILELNIRFRGKY